MTRSNTRQIPQQPAHESAHDSAQQSPPEAQGADQARAPARDLADFERRLRAAGIDPDSDGPEDMDAFRNDLARRIAMYINTWRGCPEGLCRRQRGCMAPNIRCSNATLPPDPDGTIWDEARINTRRALDEFFAEHGLEDD